MSLSFSRYRSFPTMKGGLRSGIMDITLDGAYAAGGWSVTYANLLLDKFIANLQVPPFKDGYGFDWDHVNGKLRAWQPVQQMSFIGAMAEFTMYPSGSGTEVAAAYCKGGDGSATPANLATISAEAGYTNNYQLFPDAPAAGDALYLGHTKPFGYLELDISATAQTYDAAGVLAWQYYGAAGWTTLTVGIDKTGSTGTTGAYFGEQDGKFIFSPPNDWAAYTVGGQSAYWIRAVIQAGKAANMTQVGITNSKEHLIWEPTTGIVAPRNGLLTGLTIRDQAATLHTANDIKFILMNFTTGKGAGGQLVFPQDIDIYSWALSQPIKVSADDKLGIALTQEDGTNEATALFTLHYVAEALASDQGLSGKVLRCQYVGA